jgi:hypothetical protein
MGVNKRQARHVPTVVFAENQIKITKRMEIWQMSTPKINSIFKEVSYYHEYSRDINKNGVKWLKYTFASKVSL